eukprot:TRINITY_DN1769_c4_g1_i1.p1 TRINITY_DN1769_c4_g1~~TRINITY_DN1769_c4_g1_i1.p1  ORF type:complete len:386 (+),score=101.94 TRINITY_DN1769_c4_g1_i1:32-1189(+)
MAFDCDMGDRGCLPSIKPAAVGCAPPAYDRHRAKKCDEPPSYIKNDQLESEKAPVRNLSLSYDCEDSGGTKVAFDALRAANSELHTTLTEATEALEILRLENEEERKLNGQLTSQNSKLLQQISNCNKAITDDSIRQQLDLLVDQLSIATSENASIRSEMRELSEKNQMLLQTSRTNNEVVDELQREVATLRSSQQQESSSLTDEVLHRNEILTNQVLALTQCAEESQKRSDADQKKLTQQLQELSRENELLTDRIEDSSDSEAKARLQAENTRLRNQLRSLTDKKEDEIDLLDQLQSQVGSLRTQLQISRSELATAESEVVDIRAKLSRCHKCSECSQTGLKHASGNSATLTSTEEDLLIRAAEQQLTICSDYLSIGECFDMRD